MPENGKEAFSEHMYCSAAEERLCAVPGSGARVQPGSCFWYTPAGQAVTSDIDGQPPKFGINSDMDTSKKPRWPRDTWDPILAGAVSKSTFVRSVQLRRSCTKGKRILFLGESTTRDLFFEFGSAMQVPAG